MTNINTNNWKFFKISDWFIVEKSKNINAENALELLGNDIPYITRTEFNNGCKHFVNISLLNNYENGNCITIGGEGANVFYQPLNFISGNNITKIYNQNLNENNSLFIVTILNKEKYRYSYNRAFNKTCVENTRIKLPADQNGNPDWDYMTNYIKGLRKNEKENSELAQPLTHNQIKLNTNKWAKFTIDEIFYIKNGSGITKDNISLEQNKENYIPAIQGGDLNNGILGYLPKNSVFPFIDTCCLTLARVGSAGAINFYKNGCYIGDKAKALVIKDSRHRNNPYLYLFLKPLLESNKYRFCYGRGIVTEKYKKTIIKLPVDQNGKPDWKFMEAYIQSLPYSKYL